MGEANFFLSINELNKAKELKNYYVYIVFEILSNTPKVWKVENPFKQENEKVRLDPISL